MLRWEMTYQNQNQILIFCAFCISSNFRILGSVRFVQGGIIKQRTKSSHHVTDQVLGWMRMVGMTRSVILLPWKRLKNFSQSVITRVFIVWSQDFLFEHFFIHKINKYQNTLCSGDYEIIKSLHFGLLKFKMIWVICNELQGY